MGPDLTERLSDLRERLSDLEEGRSGRIGAGTVDDRSFISRAQRALRDPEVITHFFYGVGMSADAAGRGLVDKDAIKAGATIIAGIDGSQQLREAVFKWSDKNQTVTSYELFRGTVNSLRYLLQAGTAWQTLDAINSANRNPLILELNRGDASKAGFWGMAAAAADFGSLALSIRERWKGSSNGLAVSRLEQQPPEFMKVLMDVIKDPKDRTRIVDGIAQITDGLARYYQIPSAVAAGTAVQLTNYAVNEVLAEAKRHGPVGIRTFLGAAKATMYLTFAATTARTWLSVVADNPDPKTTLVHRAGLKQSQYFSAVAAGAATLTAMGQTVSNWGSDPARNSAESASVARSRTSTTVAAAGVTSPGASRDISLRRLSNPNLPSNPPSRSPTPTQGLSR